MLANKDNYAIMLELLSTHSDKNAFEYSGEEKAFWYGKATAYTKAKLLIEGRFDGMSQQEIIEFDISDNKED